MNTRPALAGLGLGTGRRPGCIAYSTRTGSVTGPRYSCPMTAARAWPEDFTDNPAASDPKYIIKLALEGEFNSIAIQIGLAQKCYWDYAGEVPLVLKLNGK